LLERGRRFPIEHLLAKTISGRRYANGGIYDRYDLFDIDPDVCTENFIRVDDASESPKLAE
jgi:hypothetical protein